LVPTEGAAEVAYAKAEHEEDIAADLQSMLLQEDLPPADAPNASVDAALDMVVRQEEPSPASPSTGPSSPLESPTLSQAPPSAKKSKDQERRDRISSLQMHCKRSLGDELFERAYKLTQELLDLDSEMNTESEQEKRDELQSMLSKAGGVHHMHTLHQLIITETLLADSENARS
jgi:hypothetical protein